MDRYVRMLWNREGRIAGRWFAGERARRTKLTQPNGHRMVGLAPLLQSQEAFLPRSLEASCPFFILKEARCPPPFGRVKMADAAIFRRDIPIGGTGFCKTD